MQDPDWEEHQRMGFVPVTRDELIERIDKMLEQVVPEGGTYHKPGEIEPRRADPPVQLPAEVENLLRDMEAYLKQGKRPEEQT
jgi:hypothetical protein